VFIVAILSPDPWWRRLTGARLNSGGSGFRPHLRKKSIFIR